MTMKKIRLVLFGLLLSLGVNAQLTPQTSALGNVHQTIGVTNVSLSYHRPSVKGREIFGKLLPFDAIWRMGANASTKITTTDTLTFDDNILAPGTYALFTIPHADNTFTVIFNTNFNQRGTADYDANKDAFRVKVAAQKWSKTETLFLGFENVIYDSAELIMLWDEVKLSVPFTVKTTANTIRAINNAIAKGDNLQEVYEQAGNFYFGKLKDVKRAMVYADKSIKLGENYRNLFLKAKLLAESGALKKAIAAGEKAVELSKINGSKGYTNYIAGTVKGWKEKK